MTYQIFAVVHHWSVQCPCCRVSSLLDSRYGTFNGFSAALFGEIGRTDVSFCEVSNAIYVDSLICHAYEDAGKVESVQLWRFVKISRRQNVANKCNWNRRFANRYIMHIASIPSMLWHNAHATFSVYISCMLFAYWQRHNICVAFWPASLNTFVLRVENSNTTNVAPSRRSSQYIFRPIIVAFTIIALIFIFVGEYITIF